MELASERILQREYSIQFDLRGESQSASVCIEQRVQLTLLIIEVEIVHEALHFSCRIVCCELVSRTSSLALVDLETHYSGQYNSKDTPAIRGASQHELCNRKV